MEIVSDYPVVVFDLDGTLLRGTTVSLLLAQWLGQAEEIAELERAFHAYEISNSPRRAVIESPLGAETRSPRGRGRQRFEA
jgi:phosphoserine phosphatase